MQEGASDLAEALGVGVVPRMPVTHTVKVKGDWGSPSQTYERFLNRLPAGSPHPRSAKQPELTRCVLCSSGPALGWPLGEEGGGCRGEAGEVGIPWGARPFGFSCPQLPNTLFLHMLAVSTLSWGPSPSPCSPLAESRARTDVRGLAGRTH